MADMSVEYLVGLKASSMAVMMAARLVRMSVEMMVGMLEVRVAVEKELL